MDGVDPLRLQLGDRLVLVKIKVLGGDLALLVGLRGQAVAVIQEVGDLGFLGIPIDHLFDPFAEAVVRIFSQQSVILVDLDRALLLIVLVVQPVDPGGAARLVIRHLLGGHVCCHGQQAVTLARFGIAVGFGLGVALAVRHLFFGAVAQCIVGVAVIAQAGVGFGQAAQGVVAVLLQGAVEVDTGDLSILVIGVVQRQRPVVGDPGQLPLSIEVLFGADAIAIGMAGDAVGGVLVNLADEGLLRKTEQGFLGDGSELARLVGRVVGFTIIVVVEDLAVGQGLLGQSLLFVISMRLPAAS